MTRARLGDAPQARDWYDRAVSWAQQHRPQDETLRRLRTEAEALLAGAAPRPVR